MIKESEGKQIHPTYSLEDFVNSLEKPRKILLMVKAGPATDATIDSLLPLLDDDDILIDGVIQTIKIQFVVTKLLLKVVSTLLEWGFLVVKSVR